MDKNIVIYCPGKPHEQPRFSNKTDKLEVVKKILLVASESTSGKIKVQCNDSVCKHSRENHNGWFEIDFNGLGGYTITSLPRKFFDLTEVPIVVMDEL